MSLFSIIVPVYKAEKYLDDCIKSLLKQTITDFEVILVDDGSPDRSGEICDDYSEKYKFIKTIHKKNEGLVSARKAGAKVAVGKYIVCVDSDDWVDDGYLEKFYTIIKRFQPDIICSGMKRVFGEKSKKVQIKQRSGFYSKSQIEEEIFPILIQGENGSTLSGGERQRISIARALLKNAPIILLDEATASLDPENEVLVQKAIAKLIEGKTVIMIAHRLRTVVDADQIFVLENGKLVESGTHNELMKKQGLYQKLYHIQQESLGWVV